MEHNASVYRMVIFEVDNHYSQIIEFLLKLDIFGPDEVFCCSFIPNETEVLRPYV